MYTAIFMYKLAWTIYSFGLFLTVSDYETVFNLVTWYSDVGKAFQIGGWIGSKIWRTSISPPPLPNGPHYENTLCLHICDESGPSHKEPFMGFNINIVWVKVSCNFDS